LEWEKPAPSAGFFIDPHPSQLRSASQTLRCDTFPLLVLRTKGEGSFRMLMVAPRCAALEIGKYFLQGQFMPKSSIRERKLIEQEQQLGKLTGWHARCKSFGGSSTQGPQNACPPPVIRRPPHVL
jgi:hypothetical protein